MLIILSLLSQQQVMKVGIDILFLITQYSFELIIELIVQIVIEVLIYIRSESLFTWNQDFTVNFWFCRTGAYDSGHWNIMAVGTRNNPNCWISWIKPETWMLYNGWWSNDRDTWYLVPQDARLNIVYSHSNNNMSIYVNWVSYYNGWVSYGIRTGYTAIWCWVNYENPVIWNFSNVIFENVWWTAQEVADYYNNTKSIYGL